MSMLDGRVDLGGYAVVGPDCPIRADVVGGQVSFDFGVDNTLMLVLSDEEVVERFGEVWTRAAAQVAAWRAGTDRPDHGKP